MLRRIAAFELRYQLRQPLLWVTAAVFLALAFVATTTDALQLGGAIGSLNRNAPYVVVRMLGNLTLVGAFIVVAVVAGSALRDFERGTAEIVFTRPIKTRDLLAGRFLGSLTAAFVCFAFAVVGLAVGGLMPWLDPERIGPFDLRPHLYALGVIALPSFFVLGAVLFALATKTRSAIPSYVGLVAMLVADFMASAMLGDVESGRMAALLDPFGLAAFDVETRYWTVAEKNIRLPSLGGPLLVNRLVWLAIGVGVLAWAVARFRYEPKASGKKARGGATESPAPAPTGRLRAQPGFGWKASAAQLWSACRLEARLIVISLPFVIILAFGLVNMLGNIGYLDLMFGTPVWPVTRLTLIAISAGYSFLLVIILTFYAGEMVWRERRLKMDGIVDASPVSTWVPLVAELFALWTASAAFIAGGMLALMGYQLSQGYTRLEPLLYAQGLLVVTVPFLLMAVLALFLQVVVNQKFAGYLLMVLYIISGAGLSALHFDHPLYRYGAAPSAPYSDMNGWGHFLTPVFWFDLYWSFGAAVLMGVAYVGFVRGESGLRARWAEARARFRGRARWATALLLAAFAATGAFIYYNTNVLNQYIPSDEALRRQAEYEKKYRPYKDLPQPKIASIEADVDLFPAERRLLIRGTYALVNRTDAPITALHLGVPRRYRVRRLELPSHRIALDDRRLGYAIYDLETPLAPGQQMSLQFEIESANRGFVAASSDTAVVENGTFFDSRFYFPSFGYQEDREIEDPAERRHQGLPPPPSGAKMDDVVARRRNDLASDADWIDFETTISTAADQIAVAPGYLQREWLQGGRRYFHYKMDAPIPKFFAYLSARYAVKRDSWQGVNIEVFYQPGHEWNLGRMVDAVKKTLAYMTESFSPYQHRQMRIVEFPRYRQLAASFPNTVPFSESVGFIARLTDEDAIDYPFAVTAHEVAHQWWGYQVLGADVQGSGMLSETMAEYSSLMVMEHEYGASKMRRFLRYELDRYLAGRGGELIEELPLEIVESQPYIYYNKGSLALYAIKDAIGERALNDALRRYIASVRDEKPPYTISRDLIAFVTAATPPEKRSLLTDLFTSIVLFDNQVTDATYRALPDGRYEVSVKAKARKLHADGKGVETEVALDDWIDVGVFGEGTDARGRKEERALYLEKQHVTSADVVVKVVVNERPVRAGIDPYNKLIDRIPSDNVRAVSRE